MVTATFSADYSELYLLRPGLRLRSCCHMHDGLERMYGEKQENVYYYTPR